MKSLYDSFVNTAKTSRQGSLQARPGAAAEWRRDRNAVDDINIQSRCGCCPDDFPLHASRRGTCCGPQLSERVPFRTEVLLLLERRAGAPSSPMPSSMQSAASSSSLITFRAFAVFLYFGCRIPSLEVWGEKQPMSSLNSDDCFLYVSVIPLF